MLPLRKHAQHAFFAVLATSLCGCFGAAELRARRHDLQQRRFHADVFAGTGNGESVWRALNQISEGTYKDCHLLTDT